MTQKGLTIVIVVLVILFLIWWWNSDSTTYTYATTGATEKFDDIAGVDPMGDPEHYDSNLADYYNNASTQGIKPFLVDTMTCSPACCGSQWPVPFDNLSSGQLEGCIRTANGGPSTDYVRSNYTCANGPEGRGCPCIDKRAYEFLGKRGNNNSDLIGYIDPSFIIKTNTSGAQVGNQGPMGINRDSYNPYEQLKASQSYYTNERLLNDVGQMRRQYDIQHVTDYNAANDDQVAFPPGWIASLNPAGISPNEGLMNDPANMLDQYA
jgi:hypothetical protein